MYDEEKIVRDLRKLVEQSKRDPGNSDRQRLLTAQLERLTQAFEGEQINRRSIPGEVEQRAQAEEEWWKTKWPLRYESVKLWVKHKG